MSLTLDEDGKALTETIEGSTMPVDFSFAVVNDFVHASNTQYEDLQYLCLGMSTNYEKQKKEIERLRFLVTNARHDLFKKKLITFDEVKQWQV